MSVDHAATDISRGPAAEFDRGSLHHILQLLSTDTGSSVVNQPLLALRLASQQLVNVSDSVRISITLHPSLTRDAIPYLSKLQTFAAVTIRASQADNPPLRSFSHLRSLTLDSGCEAQTEVHGVAELLLPLRHSLVHLCLLQCTLLSGTHGHGSGMTSTQTYWVPDVPSLRKLLMSDATHATLDSRLSTALLGPQLRDCTSMTSPTGPSSLKALTKAVSDSSAVPLKTGD